LKFNTSRAGNKQQPNATRAKLARKPNIRANSNTSSAREKPTPRSRSRFPQQLIAAFFNYTP